MSTSKQSSPVFVFEVTFLKKKANLFENFATCKASSLDRAHVWKKIQTRGNSSE